MIFLAGLATSLALLANPGFFSHDEYTIADFVLRHGFAKFVATYVVLTPGEEFGVPVRPVSFLVQGIVARYVYTYPAVVHLADVLMHIAVTATLFAVTRRFTGNRQFAWTAALVFLVCPLAAFSTGWSAALMDRLYVLFGLAAFAAAHDYLLGSGRKAAVAGILCASTLAVFSKETALVLPATLAVFVLFAPVSIRSCKLWIAFAAWSTPAVLYLFVRAPAVWNTLSGAAGAAYSISPWNVPESVVVYALYPLLAPLREAHVWHRQPDLWIVAAALAHLALVGLLWRAFSLKAAVAYLFGYFILLAPVLPIPAKGAHYLYGSALAFSLALAALMTLPWRRSPGMLAAAPFGILGLAIWHTAVVQGYLYRTGVCTSIAVRTMESAHLSAGSPSKVGIVAENGAPLHVLRRLAYERTSIGRNYPVSVQAYESDEREAATAAFRFNRDCVVYVAVPER